MVKAFLTLDAAKELSPYILLKSTRTAVLQPLPIQHCKKIILRSNASKISYMFNCMKSEIVVLDAKYVNL